jgi:hypothetical protein
VLGGLSLALYARASLRPVLIVGLLAGDLALAARPLFPTASPAIREGSGAAEAILAAERAAGGSGVRPRVLHDPRAWAAGAGRRGAERRSEVGAIVPTAT